MPQHFPRFLLIESREENHNITSLSPFVIQKVLDFDWTVSEDQHGSDHFPVIIESVNNSTNDHHAKWKLNKANWELYHSLCEESLKIDKFNNSLDPLDDFTSSLLLFSISLTKVYRKPRQIQRKASHGIMMNAKMA